MNLKSNSSLIALIVIFSLYNFAFAENTKIVKVKILPVMQTLLSGYDFDEDQAFKFSSGPLKDKYIFFASRELGSQQSGQHPRFVISDSTKILDSVELPMLEDGWNLVSVQAISSADTVKKNGAVRILAIVTLEPLSGRPEDYWNQPYVFDISPLGKIDSNNELNKKLDEKKPRPKNIGQLKKFLNIK